LFTSAIPIGKILSGVSGENPTTDGPAAEPDLAQCASTFVRSMCSILLVEDHHDTQRAFAAILRSWGHQVATSDSAGQGLDFLDRYEVDVVLSDIGLPDQNGYDFIAQVRKRKPDVATIAVSAYFTAADQDRGHDAGFDMYFAKPVDLVGLERALVRIDSRGALNGAEENPKRENSKLELRNPKQGSKRE
jgi:CheY-like chemotaxis protein